MFPHIKKQIIMDGKATTYDLNLLAYFEIYIEVAIISLISIVIFFTYILWSHKYSSIERYPGLIQMYKLLLSVLLFVDLIFHGLCIKEFKYAPSTWPIRLTGSYYFSEKDVNSYALITVYSGSSLLVLCFIGACIASMLYTKADFLNNYHWTTNLTGLLIIVLVMVYSDKFFCMFFALDTLYWSLTYIIAIRPPIDKSTKYQKLLTRIAMVITLLTWALLLYMGEVAGTSSCYVWHTRELSSLSNQLIYTLLILNILIKLPVAPFYDVHDYIFKTAPSALLICWVTLLYGSAFYCAYFVCFAFPQSTPYFLTYFILSSVYSIRRIIKLTRNHKSLTFWMIVLETNSTILILLLIPNVSCRLYMFCLIIQPLLWILTLFLVEQLWRLNGAISVNFFFSFSAKYTDIRVPIYFIIYFMLGGPLTIKFFIICYILYSIGFSWYIFLWIYFFVDVQWTVFIAAYFWLILLIKNPLKKKTFASYVARKIRASKITLTSCAVRKAQAAKTARKLKAAQTARKIYATFESDTNYTTHRTHKSRKRYSSSLAITPSVKRPPEFFPPLEFFVSIFLKFLTLHRRRILRVARVLLKANTPQIYIVSHPYLTLHLSRRLRIALATRVTRLPRKHRDKHLYIYPLFYLVMCYLLTYIIIFSFLLFY